MADDTISLTELNQLTLPHRQAITDALKSAHDTALISGDPAFSDRLDALHATLAAGDQVLVNVINRDGEHRAQPMDGGGGDSKKPS